MTLFALAVAARLVLAAVFVVAGVAKLADRAGTRRAMGDFGAPTRLVGAMAIAVPLAELAVAGLLVPASTAVAGALGALALLALFTAAIAVSLLRGRTPDCHCFGQLHSSPAGWRTLARNGGLLAVGVVALAGSIAEPPPSSVGWLGELETPVLVALGAAGAVAALLAAGGSAFLTLMRSYGTVLVRLERVEAALADAGIELEHDEAPRAGLEPGTPAPWFLGKTPAGSGLSRDELLAPDLPVLLFFTSPHCGPCAALLPDAARWQREHADVLTLAFASEGAAEAVGAEAGEFELARVLVDESGEIAASFEARGTPSAVLISPDGRIASWLASGRDEIDALLDEAVGAGEEDGGLPIGAEAPALELPSLEGDAVSLTSLRGRDTVFLFWNPGCGYCRAMHDDLVTWEQTANGVTPRLVVVSSGDPDETRADGFRSTVLLDDGFELGTAFQAGGTPMAVHVDADGRVASGLVTGASAVLELVNRHV